MSEKYRWASRRYEAIVPARTFGQWLTALPDQNPVTVVEQAASPRSPAHKLFEWDNTRAAQQHRLSQARVILGSFVIETEIISPGKRTRTISIPYVSRSAPGMYEITSLALRQPGKRDFMLNEALKEAKRWRRRYADLSELSIVFSALDEIESRTTRRRKRG